jgi:charged multivesicular body protein 4
MADIQDQMDLANEISDAISQPVGFGMDMDEEELDAELSALQQEEMDEQLLNVGAPPVSLPSSAAPIASRSQKQPAVVDDEEDELEELRAAMAL